MSKSVIIAVDFDGTIVEHRYPEIGRPVPGAIVWLKRLQDAGALLILWTMRSGGRPDGFDPLADAVDYCRRSGLNLFGVNSNPEQGSWTQSPKAYAHIYVDDAAFGCPLRHTDELGARPYVDWDAVGPALYRQVTGQDFVQRDKPRPRTARKPVRR